MYGALTVRAVMAADPGTQRMQEIAAAIQEGAQAYLTRQYSTIAIAGAVIFVIVGLLLGWLVALGFLIGAVLSGSAGFIGMLVSVRANVRTAQAATRSLAEGLSMAFRAGAVTGLLVAGLALLGVSVYFHILTESMGLAPTSRTVVDSMVALGFGASLISIFARLGGGIFTKGADVGGDLVGKVEAGIPEDDPRNPATIADNVGDNVGDCAGMAADLFETYAVTVVATMVLAAIYFNGQPIVYNLMLYPLAVCAVGVVASIIGTFFVRLGANQSIMGALYKGFIATGVISIIALWPVTDYLLGMGTVFSARGIRLHGHGPLLVRRRRPGGDGGPHRRHGILHGHQLPPRAIDCRGIEDRPRHQRHPGPCRVARGDRAAGADHRCRHHRLEQYRRAVRHRHRRHRHAVAGGRRGGARRLRSGHRQRRRHRRDGGPAEGDPQDHGRARCGRQHHQGRDQGLRHRLGGPGRARAVCGLQRGPALLHQPGQAGLDVLRPQRGRAVLAQQPLRRRRPVPRWACCLTCSVASP